MLILWSELCLEAAELSKEFGDGFGFDEFPGLFQVVEDDGFGVDAEGVVDGGKEFGGVNGVFGGAAAGLVGFAVDVAAFDAGASDHGGIAIGPVADGRILMSVRNDA